PAYAHPRSYVAAVGRLVPQKGFDVLLEAFARLDAPEVDLLIAGDGPERRRLEALRERLGLGARVHLLGAVDRATVASLYQGARLVVCPSRWEGLPLVCLEAMASGRAVVASRVDGIPDAVGDGETGLLVQPEDPVALAGALRALLDDGPRRERLGALGTAARAAGHEVSAIVDGGGPGTFGRERDLLLYPFPARARELRRLRRFAQKFPLRAMRLVSAVRAAAPDVVSVHCTRRFAPYVAVLRRATGVPHVLSLQEGALPPGMPENPGLFRLLVRAAGGVAACSAA